MSGQGNAPAPLLPDCSDKYQLTVKTISAMKNLLTFFLSSLTYIALSGQKMDYGCVLKLNAATQTNTNPQIPADGTTQWDALTTLGAGVYADYTLTRHFFSMARLGYIRKGYKVAAQFGTIGVPESFHDKVLHNTFDNLSLDLLLGFQIQTKSNLKWRCYSGLQTDFQLGYRLQSNFYPVNGFYPDNQYSAKWNKVILNYVAGAGIMLPRLAGLSVEFGRGITPNLRTPSLVIKNWIWSLNLYLSIRDMLPPRG